jgi:hypothetical protein
MSFGGINQTGPTGAPVFGNQGPASAPVAAGAVQGQAGASPNGGPTYFGASAESVLAAMSRGEVPANLGVSAPALGGQVSLLQAIAQGVPQNGTNGIGVSSGPAVGVGAGGETGTTFGGTQPVDAKQMASVPSVTNQYSGN